MERCGITFWPNAAGVISSGALSESDIFDRFITPALRQADWLRERILRQLSYTDGRIIVWGRLVSLGRRRRADDLLIHKGVPLAVTKSTVAALQPLAGLLT